MITQDNRELWKGTRLGRFTASMIGKLMVEPRSKAAKEAGELSETAKGAIICKAIERITGIPSYSPTTPSMKRGLLLEAAALEILSRDWKQIDACTWQPYGENAGATPDGLVDNGTATLDLKCPEDPADVVRFAADVPDMDFDALERWDRNYAWQIMMQAKAAGSKYGYLVYFTDRLPIHDLSIDDLDTVQTMIDAMAEKYSQEHEYPWSYRYATQGYFYAARGFELTEERSERIDQVLKAAERECERLVEVYRPILELKLETAA